MGGGQVRDERMRGDGMGGGWGDEGLGHEQ